MSQKQPGGPLRRRLVAVLTILRRQADAHVAEMQRTPEEDVKKRAAHAGAAFAVLHARELVKKAMR
jgi:hypothetical protein